MKAIRALLILLSLTGVAQADTFVAYNTIQNDGTSVTPRRTKLNFIGGGCVDNPISAATDCTIGGSGSGDIESVTAGNGLTGGGTSGAVTLDVVGTANEIEVGANAIGLPDDVTIGDDLTVTGDLTVDTTTLFVDSVNDIVGIGTTLPSTIGTWGGGLVVASDAALNSVELVGVETAGFAAAVSGGSVASPSTVATNKELLDIQAAGYGASNFDEAAAIQFFVDGEPATAGDTTDMPGKILFLTTPNGSGTLTTRLTIDSTGLATFADDITLSGGNLNFGNIPGVIGDATTDSVTVTTDGTGDGEVVLPNDSVGAAELLDTGNYTIGTLTANGLISGNAGIQTANGATGAGFLDVLEDSDNGTNKYRFIGAAALTSDQTCTFENDSHFIPDSCVGDGTDGGGTAGATDLNLPIYSAKLTGGYVVFTPPTADACSQGAQIDAGDGNWRLLFDATTDECATWQFIIPSNYTSTPLLVVDYSMTSATTLEVEFEAAIMCVTPGDSADIDTASFSNVAVASGTVPGTAGYTAQLTVTLTDDSCAAGDVAFVVLSTDANDATSDDATGDREVVAVSFDYT